MKERISELEKQTPDYSKELLSAIENSKYEFSEEELNKASKILDILEEKVIISKADPITNRREFLIKV